MQVKGVQTTAWTGSAETAKFWVAVERQQLQRLAEQVTGRRKEKGWTAEVLAHRSGVSWRTISRIENCESKDPREHTLQALAAAFGVGVEALTGPRLRLDSPESPFEEVLRKLNEVLSRLPEPDEDRLAVEAEEEEAARQSERSESERAAKTRGPQRQAPRRKRRA